ncbi:malonyl-ACP O-methyltransferase BioC [Marinomonas balearica]|uniref:Malonyl-[acyl-carrier protein] O-methyltransferase n=1 Tax=Marinomonas balearica TaxID=491947 RepID=A0A4R6M9T3_9GAMM|nr:malonyl-ACP O-methyltransferase BioC [Marinomonas balearica]TDO98277.1 malonyl-CoA O-methyltransferase [Marinomonas balearica]
MTTQLDKRLYKTSVARHFGRAATTYNDYAGFQLRVVDELAELLPSAFLQEPSSLDRSTSSVFVDLGAGTGSSSKALRKKYGSQPHLLSLDISVDMLKQLKFDGVNTNVCCADFEQLPIKSSSIDLFFSSLAIQWCLSLDTLLSEVNRALVPDGEFVFSTLLNGSMFELEQAWNQVDRRSHVNHYLSEAQILEKIKTNNFEVVCCESKIITMTFPSVKSALYSLKKIGASLVVEGQKEFMSKSKWKQFVGAYEEYKTHQGIPLSYQVMFSRIRKK